MSKKKQKYWAARDEDGETYVFSEVKPKISTSGPWWKRVDGPHAMYMDDGIRGLPHNWRKSCKRVIRDAEGYWILKPKKHPKNIEASYTYTYHIPSGHVVNHKGVHSRAVIGNEGFSDQLVTLTVEYVR